mmetsp:Transcript_40054/g.80897  ORF Transcript_40054/g.80897 Transcript_40054/m.80897 type:complete len:226 (+) Transcript_40054:1272-1949(+)
MAAESSDQLRVGAEEAVKGCPGVHSPALGKHPEFILADLLALIGSLLRICQLLPIAPELLLVTVSLVALRGFQDLSYLGLVVLPLLVGLVAPLHGAHDLLALTQHALAAGADLRQPALGEGGVATLEEARAGLDQCQEGLVHTGEVEAQVLLHPSHDPTLRCADVLEASGELLRHVPHAGGELALRLDGGLQRANRNGGRHGASSPPCTVLLLHVLHNLLQRIQH